jgi:hypothetical protein
MVTVTPARAGEGQRLTLVAARRRADATICLAIAQGTDWCRGRGEA